MKSFSEFLAEQVITESADESKLKHLEHTEDDVLSHGESGYHNAVKHLHHVHEALKKGSTKEGHQVTTKMDGSPSVVFGHHPKTGKFFVATKSAFNKNPKINYDHEDILKNHGHAPGLVEKLKHALHHLPKITPKHGVYQGDIMHSEGDVKTHSDHHHFKPNTIEYSAHKDSEEGKKIAKSKFGIAIHTKYHGSDLDTMHAGFHVDHENFKKHPDVHNISVHHDFSKAKYSTLQKRTAETHLKAAEAEHQKLSKEGKYEDVKHHGDHLKVYVNHTIRTGEKPTADGYIKHVSGRLKKEVDKVSSESAKVRKQKVHDDVVEHAKKHKATIDTALKLHHHLAAAKDEMTDAMSAHHPLTHKIEGKDAKPEGFVSVVHGSPRKFVKRKEFSAANFANNRGRGEDEKKDA